MVGMRLKEGDGMGSTDISLCPLPTPRGTGGTFIGIFLPRSDAGAGFSA